jgi:hypothetical protein
MLSSAATGSFLTFGDADAGFRGRIQYLQGSTDAMLFETAASEKMRISSGGNLGIGIASPTLHNNGRALHIHNPGGNSAELHLTDNTSGSASGDGSVIHHNGANLYIQNHEAGVTQFYNSGSLALTISSGGAATFSSSANFGGKISVNTGNAVLSNFGSTSIGVTNTNYTGISLGYSETASYTKTAIVQEQIGDGAARGHLHFLVDTSNDGNNATLADSKMNIHGTTGDVSITGGNVGINSTAYLSFNGTDPQHSIGYNSGIDGVRIRGQNGIILATGASATPRLTITSAGHLLVHATSAEARGVTLYGSGANGFYVRSTGTCGYMITNDGTNGATSGNFITFYNNNTGVGSIVLNGASNIQYNTTSDYRLKEDLQDFNGLDLVAKIKMYDFAWKLDGWRNYGVMAHELDEVLPQAVTGEKDAVNDKGDIEAQGVDYSKIVPVLTKAIQEQQAQIELLKQEVELLKQ